MVGARNGNKAASSTVGRGSKRSPRSPQKRDLRKLSPAGLPTTFKLKSKSSDDFGYRNVRPMYLALASITPTLSSYAKQLFCNFTSKTMTMDKMRQLLTEFTDSPELKALAAKERFSVSTFLAAFLDWAQAAAGLSTKVPASKLAMKYDVDNGTIELHLDELDRIGLRTRQWAVPISAETLREKNRMMANAPKQEKSNTPKKSEGTKRKKDTEGEEIDVISPSRRTKERRTTKLPLDVEMQEVELPCNSAARTIENGPEAHLKNEPLESEAPSLGPQNALSEVQPAEESVPSPLGEMAMEKGREADTSCCWLEREGSMAKTFWHTNALPDIDREYVHCHECSGLHGRMPCTNASCTRSYCYKCSSHYTYLLDARPGDTLYDLKLSFCAGRCPCCLNICARKACLKKPLPGATCLPEYSRIERRVLATHMLACVSGAVNSIIRSGDEEAQRNGTTLNSLSLENGQEYRLLCNRCATCIEDVHSHCRECDADICCACGKELASSWDTDAVDASVSRPYSDPEATASGEPTQRCPVCSSTSMHVQRLLPPDFTDKLLSSEAVLSTLKVGDKAETHFYDFDNRLWRLPTQADGGKMTGQAGWRPRKTRTRGSRGKARKTQATSKHIVPEMPGDVTEAMKVYAEHVGVPEALHESTALLLLRNTVELLLDAPESSDVKLGKVQRAMRAALPAQATGSIHVAPAETSSPGVKSGVCIKEWYKDLPHEDYRMAAQRPDGVQNYIWTPHVRDFAHTSSRRADTVKRFVERWAAGEPIIIRGFRGRMNWGPSLVMRAARDILAGETTVHSLIDCSDWTKDCKLSAQAFSRAYTACYGPSVDNNGVPLPMLKLKDFPPEETFAARCTRHNDDFLQMLCSAMPEYMHPTKGVLNLAAALPATAVPPDLGPKGYIAFGREEEAVGEGDSVTRLHKDLSDAINILCHVQHPPETAVPPSARCGDARLELPSCGGAGALWDLIRREDLPNVRQFLEDVISGKETECPPFMYKGRVLTSENVLDVIHDQAFMLTQPHREVLAKKYGVYPWVVEQYEWEGVLIPGGCAHQVRNLRSCIKIALDFVSPESLHECLAQREEMRKLSLRERPELKPDEIVEFRHFQDKLQVANMAIHALGTALDVLSNDDVA